MTMKLLFCPPLLCVSGVYVQTEVLPEGADWLSKYFQGNIILVNIYHGLGSNLQLSGSKDISLLESQGYLDASQLRDMK